MNTPRNHFLASLILIYLASLFLLPVSNIKSKSEVPQVGEVAQQTVIAPVTFDIPKSPKQLQEEQSLAEEQVLLVFAHDKDRTEQLKNKFNKTMQTLNEYSIIQAKLQATDSETELKSLSSNGAQLFSKLNSRISQTAIAELSRKKSIRQELTRIYHSIIDDGISDIFLASNQEKINLYKKLHNVPNVNGIVYDKSEVILIKDNVEVRLESKKLVTKSEAVNTAFELLKNKFPKSQSLQSAFYEMIYAFTAPNIFYLDEETKSRRVKAVADVKTFEGKVIKGMQVIKSGDIIDERTVSMLTALNEHMEKVSTSNYRLYNALGKYLLLFLLTAIFGFYFYRHRLDLINNVTHIWCYTSVIILQFLIFYFSHIFINVVAESSSGLLNNTDPSVYFHPIFIATILGIVLFDTTFSLTIALYFSLYFGIVNGFDLSITFNTIITSLVIMFTLNSLRYRWQFLLSSSLSFLTLAFMLLIMCLLKNQLEHYLPNLTLIFGNIILSFGLSSYFLLPIFEKIFKVTTPLTLIELSDFNHPALKHISTEAPSTFHHSIMVGNLAEKAVQSIQGDSLLVRVMALYHDIGKTIHPAHFTENQMNKSNIHDSLNPWESKDIIKNHVNEAIALARKFKLPPRIIDGIPEHHGTSVIQFFYSKAVEAEGEDKVNKDDFRYDGPKPQSKETGVLMLADSIEAITRSLDSPDRNKLEKVVEITIQNRLKEGQLDDSNLSLTDLKKVKHGFVQALESMYHTRIKYPDQKK